MHFNMLRRINQMIDSLYQYLFSSDVMEFKTKKGTQVLIRVGDRVSVYSNRFSQWFDDGVVVATFRSSIKVRYGFQRYFGSAWARGNEKYVNVGQILDFVRPQKIEKGKIGTEKKSNIRLVCARATTVSSVPSGKLDS